MRRISHGRPTRVLRELVVDRGLSQWRTSAGLSRMLLLRTVLRNVLMSLVEEYSPPPLVTILAGFSPSRVLKFKGKDTYGALKP